MNPPSLLQFSIIVATVTGSYVPIIGATRSVHGGGKEAMEGRGPRRIWLSPSHRRRYWIRARELGEVMLGRGHHYLWVRPS